MKKSVLKYGMLGFLTAFILFCLALLLGDGLNYTTQQVLGYSTMVASLSFVYFGIRHYRDHENNGAVRFGKALKIGLLISVFSALGIALFDLLYITVINPDFTTEYVNTTLKQYENEFSEEEFETKKSELIQQMKDYGHPLFMAAMMFVSTFLIGFIISLISSLILKTENSAIPS